MARDLEGPPRSSTDLEVSADAGPRLLESLIPPAQRLRRVTNTLRCSPGITTRCQFPG